MDVVTLQSAKSYAQRGKAWMYLPKGWDTAWIAAKAAQATTPAHMVFSGDSITAGSGSSDWFSTSWVARLRTRLLAAGNTLWADYWPATVYGSSLGSSVGTGPYTTFMTNSPSSCESGYGRSLVATTSGSLTFTSATGCTAFDIVYVDYANGTWTYSVDGGGAQTVTTVNASNVQNASVKKVSITGLTAGIHTLTISGASGTNVLILSGVSVYYGSAGIGFARDGFSGIRAVDLTMTRGTGAGADSTMSTPPDKIALWQGMNPGGASPDTQTGFGFPTQPACAVLAYGVNDMNLGAPLSMFRQAVNRKAAAFRRGYANCSLVFLANADPSTSLSADANPGGRSYDWHRYKSAMRDLAEGYGAAYVDMDAKWGQLAYSRGFLPAADVHPTDSGHDDISSVLASIL